MNFISRVAAPSKVIPTCDDDSYFSHPIAALEMSVSCSEHNNVQ